MKTINKLLFIPVLILMIVPGCDDDFLEKVDPNATNPDAFFVTAESLEQAVIAAYATQAVEASFSRRGFWLGDFPADDIAARDATDRFESFTYDATDDSIFRVWRAFYMIINRANQTIKYAANIEANGDEAKIAQIVAEARFLRSLYHYYLTMWWGDVPYRTEPELSDPYIEVTPRASILEAIVDDLNMAVTDLPAKNQQAASEYGRATKGAANTLLTKALMVLERWPEAEAAATEVIDDDYSLLPELRDIHDPSNSFHDEAIYQIVFNFTGGGNHDWTTFTSGGNSSTAKSSFRSYWVYRPGRDGQSGKASDKLIAAYDDPNDPRLEDFYFGPNSMANGEPYNFAERGWSLKKLINENPTDSRDTDENFIMFRLADVILLRAEARVQQNDIAGALTDLNTIRARAREGNPGLVPDITSSSQVDVLEAIKNERFIELSGEVVRLIDIKRWGDWQELGPNFTQGRDEVFPLPDSEVTNNINISQNNPGW